MGEESARPTPDLAKGVPVGDLADSTPLLGHVGDEAVILARRGDEFLAIGAQCTHYGGPLAEGLVDGDTVRCPWHHACFSLRTGEALEAPAFDPVSSWRVEKHDDKLFVREKLEQPQRAPARGLAQDAPPRHVIIIGGGAAGFACAEMLRRRGYDGDLAVLSADVMPPYDRPSLSKEYLAGEIEDNSVPLRPANFYGKNRIGLQLQAEVRSIDINARTVLLADGRSFPFDRLLLATGAEPITLSIPGADRPHVQTLRSYDDSHAIIKRAKNVRRAVVLGASFIGLEVASALRARDIEVHVVAPEARPMEKVLGPQFGDFVRSLHEEHGVVFHLQETAASIDDKGVTLKSGRSIETGLIVVGIGVKPRTELAERSGIAVAKGVVVNENLETNVPGIFAAGDIACFPDMRTGQKIRVEHWVVAERQGQTVARNMLGPPEPFSSIPYFWSKHYDVWIQYVGHAEKWDAIHVDGDIRARSCIAEFLSNGQTLAVVSIGRDIESLQAEADFERSTTAMRK